jgi:serine/threonine protein kinase
VFGQANREITAKITDFGHASLRLTEDENVRLPFSRYFNAPDYHSREFRIGDAKKFDVFNFGLIVYWLLVGRKIEAEEIRFDEDTLPFARTILSKSDLSIKQRENVLAFFLLTLADNHRDRSVEWDLLLSLLGKDDQELMLEEADSSIMDENALDSRHSENTPEANLHPKFKVSCRIPNSALVLTCIAPTLYKLPRARRPLHSYRNHPWAPSLI